MIRFWIYIKRLLVTSAILHVAVILWYIASRALSPYFAVGYYQLPLADTGSAAVDSNTLTVGSFNIAHARGGQKGASNWQSGTETELYRHLDKIVEQIKQTQVDIMVLNEVDFDAAWSFNVNQARYIARQAGFQYVVEQRNIDLSFPFYPFKFGNAILSRYPVTESEFLDFKPYSALEDVMVGNHDGVRCTLQTPMGPVGLIAVHLEYRSEDIRYQCAQYIKTFADKYNFPIIAAGDFNSTPISYSLSQRSSKGQNAMTYLLDREGFEAYSGISDKMSYYTFPSDQPQSIIDWIIEQGSTQIISAGVIASDLSDHFMVYSSMTVNSMAAK